MIRNASLIILLLALGFVLARYARRKIAWWLKNCAMRKKAESILGQLDCLRERREIGAGNIGIVYDARLGEGWQEQLGLLWKTSQPFPDRLVAKIVPIKSGSQQPEILCHLAPRIEEARQGKEPLALCPFLALGVVKHQRSQERFLVEIMPFLNGESLLKVLKKRRLEHRSAIKELLRVFETVFFLEAEGYYERSIDNENVMVLADGSWIRIDIDSAEMVQTLPRYRMIRLARLTGEVLSRLDGVPDRAKLNSFLRRLRLTANCPLKRYEGRELPEKYRNALLESPEEIRETLKALL